MLQGRDTGILDRLYRHVPFAADAVGTAFQGVSVVIVLGEQDLDRLILHGDHVIRRRDVKLHSSGMYMSVRINCVTVFINPNGRCPVTVGPIIHDNDPCREPGTVIKDLVSVRIQVMRIDDLSVFINCECNIVAVSIARCRQFLMVKVCGSGL